MTFEQMAALHARSFDGAPRPWTGAEFRSILEGAGTWLVSVEGGLAVGRCTLDEAELLTLAVSPEFRRRGLGRRLLTLHEAEAQAREAKTLYLEVSVRNHAALALYRSHGYREAGRRTGYYAQADGGRTDALVMARNPGATTPKV